MIISEEEPEDNNGLVKRVVGKTFQKEIVQSKENYAVIFYENPEEQNFKTIQKLLEFVNSQLQGNSTEPQTLLKFAQIDMIKNEVISIEIFLFLPQLGSI